jgi:DNA-binding MarR family transcriptional regulator
MDAGDKRFLAALSPVLRSGHSGVGDIEDYVLTIPHFWALVHLEPDDGRTMAELAHLLICDKSNVTKIVDKLEELGWAQRVPGKAGDRRYMRVVLTDAGRAMRSQLTAAQAEWVHRRFSILTSEQLDQLEHLLRLLLQGFQVDAEAAADDIVGTQMQSQPPDEGTSHRDSLRMDDAQNSPQPPQSSRT